MFTISPEIQSSDTLVLRKKIRYFQNHGRDQEEDGEAFQRDGHC